MSPLPRFDLMTFRTGFRNFVPEPSYFDFLKGYMGMHSIVVSYGLTREFCCYQLRVLPLVVCIQLQLVDVYTTSYKQLRHCMACFRRRSAFYFFLFSGTFPFNSATVHVDENRTLVNSIQSQNIQPLMTYTYYYCNFSYEMCIIKQTNIN